MTLWGTDQQQLLAMGGVGEGTQAAKHSAQRKKQTGQKNSEGDSNSAKQPRTQLEKRAQAKKDGVSPIHAEELNTQGSRTTATQQRRGRSRKKSKLKNSTQTSTRREDPKRRERTSDQASAFLRWIQPPLVANKEQALSD